MEISTLRRFAPLYTSVCYLGADKILRTYLDLSTDFPLPLGLSHGIDFGQMHSVLDSHGVEPIYWSYNHDLFRRASAFKQTIAIPHPFLLAVQHRRPAQGGSGTLVVGPPPGPTHDRQLLERLKGRGKFTILVKPKPNFQLSERFWHDHGYETVTLGHDGEPSYEGLADLLSRFDRVEGCTFSSVLIFAAALGKQVGLIRDFRYRVYEIDNDVQPFNYDSRQAADLCRIFDRGGTEATEAARSLLGSNMESAPTKIRTSLIASLQELSQVVHFSSRTPKVVRRILSEMALALRRPGLISRSPSDFFRGFSPRVAILEVDEIDLWLSGRKPGNPKLTNVPYVPGKTVPGDAVDPY